MTWILAIRNSVSLHGREVAVPIGVLFCVPRPIDLSPWDDSATATRVVVEQHLPGAKGSLDFRPHPIPAELVEAASIEGHMILNCRNPFGLITLNIKFNPVEIARLSDKEVRKRNSWLPFAITGQAKFLPNPDSS